VVAFGRDILAQISRAVVGVPASTLAGVGSRAPARREPHEVLSTPKTSAKPRKQQIPKHFFFQPE
jgi:hypothetical protein